MKMKIKHNSIMNINFDVFFVKIGLHLQRYSD